MGMEYWPVLGYGFEFDMGMFEPLKVMEVMGIQTTNEAGSPLDRAQLKETIGCISEDEFAEKLTKLEEYRLLVYATDGQGTYYLMYPAVLPWEMLEGEAGLTEETAKENLTNFLKQYCKPSIDIDEKIKSIGKIETYGCG